MKIKSKLLSFIFVGLMLLSCENQAFCAIKKDDTESLQMLRTDKSLGLDKLSDEEVAALAAPYKKITKNIRVVLALNAMQDSVGNFSRLALLGNNLTQAPIAIEFKNLSEFGASYTDFDALGWKKKDKLLIYINEKHKDAPPIAIAALLSHEALHQDEFNSINEETYAWTMEAAVWSQLSENFPEQVKQGHPLVVREEMLKKLFIRGNYTDKYIRKTVASNPGYSNLPSRSPGFEDDL